jgi:hypothetical protein
MIDKIDDTTQHIGCLSIDKGVTYIDRQYYYTHIITGGITNDIDYTKILNYDHYVQLDYGEKVDDQILIAVNLALVSARRHIGIKRCNHEQLIIEIDTDTCKWDVKIRCKSMSKKE